MPYRNRVLASLTRDELALLRLDRVMFKRGEIIAAVDHPFTHLIFPETGGISAIMHNGGQPFDIWMIGVGGIVGGHTLFTLPQSQFEFRGRIDGWGQRASRDNLRLAMNQSQTLEKKLQQMTRTITTVINRVLICFKEHPPAGRFARRLLGLRAALSDADILPLRTGDLIEMVGVSRQTLSAICHRLEAARIIDRTPGQVVIRDLDRLREESCDCFAAMQVEMDALWRPVTGDN